MATTSDARKRLRDQDDPIERVLRALKRIYGDATYDEASGLRDALEDEALLR